MTWQGSGEAGGTGQVPIDPDDATRADWPAAAAPPPAPADQQAGAQSSPPPEMPQPPSMPPPAAPGGTPWAPPGAADAGSWGAPPPGGGGGQYSVPGAPGLVYAGAIPRAAAYIVDSFLLGILISIVTIPFAVASVASISSASEISQVTTRTGLAAVIGALIEGAYFAFLWMSSGRATLGMRLFSLQVGSFADGARLRPDQAIKRWLAYGSWLSVFGIVPGIAGLAGIISFVWTIVLLVSTATSPTKQGLHDRFVGSAVVRPATAGNGLAITCLILALVIPVIAIFLLVSLVFLGGQVSTILSAVGDSVAP